MNKRVCTLQCANKRNRNKRWKFLEGPICLIFQTHKATATNSNVSKNHLMTTLANAPPGEAVGINIDLPQWGTNTAKIVTEYDRHRGGGADKGGVRKHRVAPQFKVWRICSKVVEWHDVLSDAHHYRWDLHAGVRHYEGATKGCRVHEKIRWLAWYKVQESGTEVPSWGIRCELREP